MANANEAQSRIKINKLLESSGWRFEDSTEGKANIQLEAGVKFSDLGDMGSVCTESLAARLIKVSHLLVTLAVRTAESDICVKHALESVFDAFSSSADARKVISQTTNVFMQ